MSIGSEHSLVVTLTGWCEGGFRANLTRVSGTVPRLAHTQQNRFDSGPATKDPVVPDSCSAGDSLRGPPGLAMSWPISL